MLPRRPVSAVIVLLAVAAPFYLPWSDPFHLDVAPAAGQTPKPQKKLPDEKAIRALIAQLGDDSFEKREEAQKRLGAIGPPALELLRKAAKDGADLETRERAAQLVGQILELRFRPTLKDQHWGVSVDPDGDCKFLLEPGELHIKIPGTPHILTAEIGGPKSTNAPRVLREIEGDFDAEVTVQGPVPANMNSLVQGRAPFFAAGLLVWQDAKNYLRIARGFLRGQCYPNWQQHGNGQVVHDLGHNMPLDARLTTSLRLKRRGDTFTASYSQDGKEWKELPPAKADYGNKLNVGVVAIQNTAAGYEAVFEGLKITSLKK
jgi:regulation of enolase protein 1 (concanavalin A-like superfamily)